MTIIRTCGQVLAPVALGEVPDGIGIVPVGTIVAWVPGYFTGITNLGYTPASLLVSADTEAAAITYLDARGWAVCNGGSTHGGLPDPLSKIFNGVTGGKVPLLNDNRFLHGCTTVLSGGVSQGGLNVLTDHTHSVSITSGAGSSHNHAVSGRSGAVVATDGTTPTTHNHTISGSTATKSVSHQHIYALPSHRHFLYPRSPGANQGHTHPFTSGGQSATHRHMIDNVGGGGAPYGTIHDSVANYSGGFYTGYTGEDHTHSGTTGNPTDHTHTFGNVWTNENSADKNAPNGDNSGNTYSDNNCGLAYWGGGSGYSGVYATLWTLSTDPAHAHDVGTLANSAEGAHFHGLGTLANVAENTHTHSVSGSSGGGSAPASTENRPQYLRCFMIMRYK